MGVLAGAWRLHRGGRPPLAEPTGHRQRQQPDDLTRFIGESAQGVAEETGRAGPALSDASPDRYIEGGYRHSLGVLLGVPS